MFKDYCKILDEYEPDTAEVSDTIEISHEEKCKHIKDLNKRVTVPFEEIHDANKLIPPYKWIEIMQKKLKQALESY